MLKTDAARLPQRDNLHWLGPVPYRLLPALMARWRLALLPFLHGPATRRAQPLKVLEALAAGLPVVAPPLSELLDAAPAGVRCAAGAAAVLSACEALFAETPAAAAARRRQARLYLAGRDWHALAARADALLHAALATHARYDPWAGHRAAQSENWRPQSPAPGAVERPAASAPQRGE